MSDGLTTEALISTFPSALSDDEHILALAKAIARVIEQRGGEVERAAIYTRITELPSDLLDILAFDFKIDWWNTDAPVEEKRAAFQKSFKVHRIRGTKAAVEDAISVINPNAKVQEWWEYGSDPYHFRIVVDVEQMSDADTSKAVSIYNIAIENSNLRSLIDEVLYYLRLSTQRYAGVAVHQYRCSHLTVPDTGYPVYVDEDGNVLLDEDSFCLIAE